MTRVLVLQGPNLNLLGHARAGDLRPRHARRHPRRDRRARRRARPRGRLLPVEPRGRPDRPAPRSATSTSAIVNAGGLTHTSVALRDALLGGRAAVLGGPPLGPRDARAVPPGQLPPRRRARPRSSGRASAATCSRSRRSPAVRGAMAERRPTRPAELRRLRRRIDALDRRIVALLNERAELARDVGREKVASGRRAVRDAEREREVLLRVSMANDGPDAPGRPPRDLPPAHRGDAGARDAGPGAGPEERRQRPGLSRSAATVRRLRRGLVDLGRGVVAGRRRCLVSGGDERAEVLVGRRDHDRGHGRRRGGRRRRGGGGERCASRRRIVLAAAPEDERHDAGDDQDDQQEQQPRAGPRAFGRGRRWRRRSRRGRRGGRRRRELGLALGDGDGLGLSVGVAVAAAVGVGGGAGSARAWASAAASAGRCRRRRGRRRRRRGRARGRRRRRCRARGRDRRGRQQGRRCRRLGRRCGRRFGRDRRRRATGGCDSAADGRGGSDGRLNDPDGITTPLHAASSTIDDEARQRRQDGSPRAGSLPHRARWHGHTIADLPDLPRLRRGLAPVLDLPGVVEGVPRDPVGGVPGRPALAGEHVAVRRRAR